MSISDDVDGDVEGLSPTAGVNDRSAELANELMAITQGVEDRYTVVSSDVYSRGTSTFDNRKWLEAEQEALDEHRDRITVSSPELDSHLRE